MSKEKASKSKAKAVKRKAFLRIVAVLEKYFGDNGLVKDEFDADDVANSLLEVQKDLPQSVKWLHDFAEVAGSALYVMQMQKQFRQIEEVSECCNGAQPFEAAFYAGWSMGFAAGQEDALQQIDKGEE